MGGGETAKTTAGIAPSDSVEAVLKDGTRIAVKVQHRDIDEIVRLDLKTIRRIMMIVQWFVPIQGLDSYYLQDQMVFGRELSIAIPRGSTTAVQQAAMGAARLRAKAFDIDLKFTKF